VNGQEPQLRPGSFPRRRHPAVCGSMARTMLQRERAKARTAQHLYGEAAAQVAVAKPRGERKEEQPRGQSRP